VIDVRMQVSGYKVEILIKMLKSNQTVPICSTLMNLSMYHINIFQYLLVIVYRYDKLIGKEINFKFSTIEQLR
jgi:hypothetical protein